MKIGWWTRHVCALAIVGCASSLSLKNQDRFRVPSSEGFSKCDEIPDFLQKCGRATVRVNNYSGSGAIVKIDFVNADTIDVYILTAWHLFRNPEFPGDPVINFKFPYRTPLVGANIAEAKILKLDPPNDLALLRTRITRYPTVQREAGQDEEYNRVFVAKIEYLRRIQPLKIGNCEPFMATETPRAFAIGFPSTELRPPRLQRVPIDDYEASCKRMSQGFALREHSVPETMRQAVSRPKAMAAYTIDVLTGSSGGPICDESDDMVGLASNKPWGSDRRYGGQDRSRQVEKRYIFSPTCQELKHFFEQNGL